MTAAVINWRDNPRYQRIIQKIQGMGPEQRAIFNTAMVDEAFAGDAMRKHLQALSLAADTKYRDKVLGLRRKEYETRKSLTQDRDDFRDTQSKWGTAIAAANIPLSGYLGYKQLQRSADEVDDTKAFRKWFKEIYENSLGGK